MCSLLKTTDPIHGANRRTKILTKEKTQAVIANKCLLHLKKIAGEIGKKVTPTSPSIFYFPKGNFDSSSNNLVQGLLEKGNQTQN